VPIAKEKGLAALSAPRYFHNRNMRLIWGTFQAAAIAFAFFLSTLKTWKKKRSQN
jgi:hypothetical protein